MTAGGEQQIRDLTGKHRRKLRQWPEPGELTFSEHHSITAGRGVDILLREDKERHPAKTRQDGRELRGGVPVHDDGVQVRRVDHCPGALWREGPVQRDERRTAQQCGQHPRMRHLASVAEHADPFRRPAEGVADPGRPDPGGGVQLRIGRVVPCMTSAGASGVAIALARKPERSERPSTLSITGCPWH